MKFRKVIGMVLAGVVAAGSIFAGGVTGTYAQNNNQEVVNNNSYQNALIPPQKNPEKVWGDKYKVELRFSNGVHLYLPSFFERFQDGQEGAPGGIVGYNIIIGNNAIDYSDYDEATNTIHKGKDYFESNYNGIKIGIQEGTVDILCNSGSEMPKDDEKHKYKKIGEADGKVYYIDFTPPYWDEGIGWESYPETPDAAGPLDYFNKYADLIAETAWVENDNSDVTQSCEVSFNTVYNSTYDGNDLEVLFSKDPSILDKIEIKLYKLSADRFYSIAQEHGGYAGATSGGITNQAIEEGELIDTWTATEEKHIVEQLTDGDYFITVNGELYRNNNPRLYFKIEENGKIIKLLKNYEYRDSISPYEEITIFEEGGKGSARELDIKTSSSDLLAHYIDPDINITDNSGNSVECEIEVFRKEGDSLEKNLTTSNRGDYNIFWLQGSGNYTAALEHPGTHIIKCKKAPYGYKKFDDVIVNTSTKEGGYPSVSLVDNKNATIIEGDVWLRMGYPVIITISLDEAEYGGLTLKNETSEKQTATITCNYEEVTGVHGTGKQGDVVFDKGVATVDIDPGESINIDNIAEGTEYTVTSDGCTVTGEKGTIVAGKNGEVLLKEGEQTEKKDTGDLTLLFNIPNLSKKEYKFKITIGNSSLNKERITGKYGGVVFKDGVGEIVYTDQKSLNITGLPAGIGYSVVSSDLGINERGVVDKNKNLKIILKRTFNPNTDWWKYENYDAERLEDKKKIDQIIDKIENKYKLNLETTDKATLKSHIQKGFLAPVYKIVPLVGKLFENEHTYSGQCYGLTLMAILNYIGFANYDLSYQFPINDDNVVTINNHDDVTEEVLFWHCTQWLNRVKEKENAFKDRDEYKKNFENLLSDLKNNVVPWLIGFDFQNGGKHVVLGYGLVDDNPPTLGYIHEIETVDSNDPTEKKHGYGTNLIYDYDGNLSSDLYLNGQNWGYLKNTHGINDIDTLTLKNNYQGEFSYLWHTSMEDSILKNLSDNNEWTIMPQKGKVEGDPVLNVSRDSNSSINESNSNSLNVFLNQYDSPYSIMSKSGERYSFSEYISYKDIFISASAESALGADFDQAGRACIHSNNGQFEIVLADNRIKSGEFNTYKITGTAANSGDITVTLTDVGVRVEGDNIAGVQIEAEEDDIVDTKTIEVNKAVEYGRKSDELIIFFDEEKDVNAFETTLSETKYVYDGQSHVPVITIKHNGKLLVEGTDYKVTLPEDTVNVGKKEIIVTGINDYSGTFKLEYEIVGESTSPTHTNSSTSNEVKTVAIPNALSGGSSSVIVSTTKSSGTSAASTGDSNYTALWICLSAAAAAAAITAGVVYSRKRKSN